MKNIETKIDTLAKNFAPISGHLHRTEEPLQGHQNGEDARITQSDELYIAAPVTMEDADGDTFELDSGATLSKPPTAAAKAQLETGYFQTTVAPQTSEPTQKHVPDIFEGEVTLTTDHKTAAHTLLMEWPVMKSFFKDVILIGKDYPREREENRGTLKLYGRGEGIDLCDGAHGGIRASEVTESARISTSTPSPETNGWGIGFTTPSTGADTQRFVPQHDLRGLNTDGTIELDARTVRRLHQSYLSHMHLLQPFLDREILASAVEGFIYLYSPNANEQDGMSPCAVSEIRPTLPVERKRKRSTTSPTSGPEGRIPPSGENHIERRIVNAIVLLVLALGSICEHRTHLPGPFGASNTVVDNARMSSIDSPLTTTKPSSTFSHSTLIGTPSAQIYGSYQIGRRQSAEQVLAGRGEAAGRNMDIIPGLAYYTFAVEIIGAVHGGNDVSHGQAGVLACLYMGQLARILESWDWICYACRVCGVLIDRSMTL